MRPKVTVRAAGISRMNSSSTKFENWVGFSNGIALFTLKNPPPFVPSCLIAICEAAGPSARVWSKPWTVWYETYGPSVWTTPWETSTSAPISDSGSRM